MAIRLDPKYAVAFFNRGSLKQHHGDDRNAIADFDSAISINPDYGAAYNGRGKSLTELGDYKKALLDFDEAIGIDRSNADAHNNRGFVKYLEGREKEALRDFDRAVSINPDFAIAYSNRGHVLFNQGKFGKAAEDFSQAVQLSRDGYAGIWLYLARSRHGESPKMEGSDSGGWVMHLQDLFSGHITPRALLAISQGNGQRCEANFYTGEFELLRGSKKNAREGFRAAIRTCPRQFVEYAEAKAELSR